MIQIAMERYLFVCKKMGIVKGIDTIFNHRMKGLLMSKKSDEMTIFGVGPKIGRIALPFCILTIAATLYFRNLFSFVLLPYVLLLITGVLMIVFGTIVNIASANQMIKAVREGKLLTTGYYEMIRNPMYASFIYLTIPGLSLVLNSWLVLTTSVVVYIVLQKFIPSEEAILEKKFGDEYKQYKSKVPRIIPFVKT